MKKIISMLIVLSIILTSGICFADEYSASFPSTYEDVDIARRLDLNELLVISGEEDVLGIEYYISDTSAGFIENGIFISTYVGSATVTAVVTFNTPSGEVTKYSSVTINVNQVGNTVRTYDVNLDGIINATDLNRLLSVYGTHDETCDFNGDGIVNATDLNILNSNYGSRM